MVVWLYKGDDNVSSIDQQCEVVFVCINQVFVGLGSGWMIYVDVVWCFVLNYVEWGLLVFFDCLMVVIEEECWWYFESLGMMYEGYFVFILIWFLLLFVQCKFVELMFDDDVIVLDCKVCMWGFID